MPTPDPQVDAVRVGSIFPPIGPLDPAGEVPVRVMRVIELYPEPGEKEIVITPARPEEAADRHNHLLREILGRHPEWEADLHPALRQALGLSSR